MDLLLVIAGVVFIVGGARFRTPEGQRAGAGIAMLTVGIVVTVIGTIWFMMGFIYGFALALAG